MGSKVKIIVQTHLIHILHNYWSKGVDFDMYTYISNTGEQSVTLTLKVKKIKGHIAIVLKLAYFAKYCSQAVDLI